jgi:hypothetical protein
MDLYKNYMVEQYRREDEIESAERYRLVKNAPGTNFALVTAYRRGLASLGAFLVSLGKRLSCQFGSLLSNGNKENYQNTVRDFLTALEQRNPEKTLSFLAEDATWTTPAATYTGKEVIRRYLTWEFEMVPSLTITETGTGLMVRGNQALIEHILAGTVRGERCEWLSMCAYKFDTGHIQEMRTVFDRLSLLQQSATGWLESKVVDLVASQTESNL